LGVIIFNFHIFIYFFHQTSSKLSPNSVADLEGAEPPPPLGDGPTVTENGTVS